jgi:hypothetical protein
MYDLGFIILRHVNSEKTDNYWKNSYNKIRKYYNNKIIIIDDNSDNYYLREDILLNNCQIIKSEFKGAGEILPYYYFNKLHPFEKAVIIHDSVFFECKIIVEDIKDFIPLWHFENYSKEFNILNKLTKLTNSNAIIDIYNKGQWNGCFGAMSIINWDFLNMLENNHQLLSNLITEIKNREDRMSFERVISIVSQYYINNKICGLLGSIHNYCNWCTTYEDYLNNKIKNLPIIKVWTGR